MDLSLRGKVVLITGGARGIGEAIVRAFTAEEARVVFADRNEIGGKALAAELNSAGHATKFIKADLIDEEACAQVVEQAVSAYSTLDVLINNAGVNDHISLSNSLDDFAASLGRNLYHVFSITHFALAHLIKSQGAIVNLSSKVAVTGQGHTSGYAAAKGAINALTREWAVALAPHGIRVNAVAPAECLTPQYEEWFGSRPDPAAAKAGVEQLIPLGRRMTTKEEIAATVVFLASERSSHTTGEILFVDGGYTHLDRAFKV